MFLQFNLKRGGQRVATMLMYLSDDVEGGETHFPLVSASHFFQFSMPIPTAELYHQETSLKTPPTYLSFLFFFKKKKWPGVLILLLSRKHGFTTPKLKTLIISRVWVESSWIRSPMNDKVVPWWSLVIHFVRG